MPDEIKERVAAVVNKEMQMLRSIMEEQFSGQENKLKEKIKQMEATAGKDGDAKPGSRAQSPKTGLRKAAAAGAAGAAGAHS